MAKASTAAAIRAKPNGEAIRSKARTVETARTNANEEEATVIKLKVKMLLKMVIKKRKLMQSNVIKITKYYSYH